MKKHVLIALVATVTILFTSCGGTSLKKKVEGKWRWDSIKQKSGDVLSMMEDELYFSFKDGMYLYTDASAGKTENWSEASPFTIDEKTRIMTIKGKAGALDDHYEISFTEDGSLLLIINDPESTLFRDTWVLKKVK